jgi:hypothetical protein
LLNSVMIADRVEEFSMKGDDPTAPDGKRRTPPTLVFNPEPVGGRTTPRRHAPTVGRPLAGVLGGDYRGAGKA